MRVCVNAQTVVPLVGASEGRVLDFAPHKIYF